MNNKILMVVPTLHQKADGVAKFVIDFYCKMIATESSVDVVALKWKDEGVITSVNSRLFKVSFGLYKLGFSIGMMRWLRREGGRSQYTIIHSHGMWMMPGIFATRPASKRTYKFIISPHGSLSNKAFLSGSAFKKPFWYLFQRRSLKLCDGFHATSIEEYNDIRRLGFTQPVCIIPPGVHMPVFKKKTVKQKNLLFLARISPIKGLDILLEAWKQLEDRYCEWNLIVAGPSCDGYLEDVMELSQRLGLRNIEFFGPAYGKRKEQLYIDSDIYILPSYSENFGITVAEALSYATPVVVTKDTPWSKVVEKQAGWWVEANTSSLLSCLEEALSVDIDTLQKMGLSGRRWMAEDFSWDVTVDKFNQAYNWIVTEENRPKWIKD